MIIGQTSSNAEESAKVETEEEVKEPAVVQLTKEQLEEQNHLCELNKLRISSKTVIPDEQPIVSILGVSAYCIGDLVSVKAKAKNGKTTSLKYQVAAILKGELGALKGELEESKAIWLATEESENDVMHIVKDIQQISGLPTEYIDSHLRIYTFRKRFYTTLPKDTELLIKNYRPDLVVIDGIVDYISSFNDEVNSKDLVSCLIRMADTYKCAIISVLHENKSNDDHNMRGHLGTMLQQKSSAVFQCTLKDGVITVTCTDSRHMSPPDWHIMFDRQGHIVSADMSDGTIDNPDRLEARQRFETIKRLVQENGGSMARNSLTAELMAAFNLSRPRVSKILSEHISERRLSENNKVITLPQDLFSQAETDAQEDDSTSQAVA